MIRNHTILISSDEKFYEYNRLTYKLTFVNVTVNILTIYHLIYDFYLNLHCFNHYMH